MSLDESIGKIEVDPKEEASERLRRIGVETRLKGYKYFEIERDFFNKLGVLVDGDFKFGVLYLFLLGIFFYFDIKSVQIFFLFLNFYPILMQVFPNCSFL
jgi:hypothetical protein